MLSVLEALQLKALDGAKLIAGEQGADRSIKWITTIEIIEDITRFHEGEFVVTTGYGLAKDPYYEERIIELLNSNKPSALALHIGFYIEEIPINIIETANKNNIPLIEIPSVINFSTITKAIVEQIGNEQMKLLEESLNIHKEMTKLAMNNDGLKGVLGKLSPLIGCSLIVSDNLGYIQAASLIHSSIVLENNHKIKVNHISIDIQQLMEKLTQENKRTTDFHDEHYHCYCSFINDDSFPYGFLLALHQKELWTNMDEIIIDHVATLIGIELVKHYAVEETKMKLQGKLVEEIIMKEQLNKSIVLRRGKMLGFDLRKTQAVLYFKVNIDDDGAYEQSFDFSTQLHYVVSQVLLATKRQAIFMPKLNVLFAIIEIDMDKELLEKKTIQLLAKEIHERWKKHFSEELLIGIGNPYEDLHHLSMSAKEAEYAVQYAPLLFKESFVIQFDDLGFYQILIRMQEAGISLVQFYKTYLRNLIDQKNYHSDLLLTLEAYLAHNCNMQQTAQALYIHRHTLKYRLSQIEKKTGFSLQSPDDRLNLHLAILAFKFVQLQESH